MTIRPEDVDAIADAAAHVILTRPLGTADGKPYTVGQALRQLRSDAAAARRDAAAALTVLPNLAAALEAVSPGDAVVEEVRSALESLVVRLEVTDPTAETAVDGVDPLES